MVSNALVILATFALAIFPKVALSQQNTTSTTSPGVKKNPKMDFQNDGDLIASVPEGKFGYRHGGQASPVFLPVDGVASAERLRRVQNKLGGSSDESLSVLFAKNLEAIQKQTSSLDEFEKMEGDILATATKSQSLLQNIRASETKSESYLSSIQGSLSKLFSDQTKAIVDGLHDHYSAGIFKFVNGVGSMADGGGLPSCTDYQQTAAQMLPGSQLKSGLYLIQAPSGKKAATYCAMDWVEAPGAWTVLTSNGKVGGRSCEPCIGGCGTNLGCGVVHPALLSDFTLDVEVQKAVTWSKIMVVTYKGTGIIKPTGGFGIDFKTPLPTKNRRVGGKSFQVGQFQVIKCTKPLVGYDVKTCSTTKNPTMTKFFNIDKRETMAFHLPDSDSGWADFRDGCACGDKWGPRTNVAKAYAAVFVQ